MKLRSGKRRGGRTVGGGGGLTGLRWSDPGTWPGGVFPDANTTVNIPVGQTYIVDTMSAVAADVQVFGTLIGDPAAPAKLTTGWIDVRSTGVLQLGASKTNRYAGQFDIELNGDEADSPSSLRYGHDQTASTVAGDGRLTQLHVSLDVNLPTTTENITVTFTSASAFDVSGSVSGSLGSGTVGVLFNNKIRFIAAGTFASGETVTVEIWQQGRRNNGVSRAINIHSGGIVRMHASHLPTHVVPLGANVAAGASTFTLASAPSNWRPGDLIVVSGSQYRDVPEGQSQALTIQSIAGTSLTTTSAITAARWGVLQYVTDTGLSLTPGTLPTKPAAMLQADYDAISKTVDERARVVNLSRNIRIYSADDSAWSSNGFGFHIMRHPGGLLEMDGVELFRGGQRGNFGRYPVHLHCGSYEQPYGMNLPSNGTLIGSVNDYVDNCVVRDTAQRGIVCHMIRGGAVRNNVLYNTVGHAVFMEDGSETETIIHDNVVIKTADVPNVDAFLVSEVASPPTGEAAGAAGFWLANPYLDFQRNQAFECPMIGIWNAWAQDFPLALSREIAMVPKSMPVLAHSNNRASGCGRLHNGFETSAAMVTGISHISNRGAVSEGTRYLGPAGARQLVFGAELSFASRLYFNRIGTLEYRGWTSSSTQTWCFVGAASNVLLPGVIKHCLGAGWTLNNSTLRNTYTRWMTSYHELLNAQDAIVINFPYAPVVDFPTGANVPQFGAAIGGGDLYTNSMFNLYEFKNIIPINSLVLFRPRPPHIGDGAPVNNRFWTYAGAVQDKNGISIPAGRFRVYDEPFLTFGLTDQVALTPAGVGEFHTAKRHFGVQPTNTNAETNPYAPRRALNTDRLDPGNLSSVVGTWNIADGTTSSGVVFRSFTAAQDGIYRMTWPNDTVNYAMLAIEFLTEPTDSFVVAVEKFGGAPTAVFLTTRDFNVYSAGQQEPVPTAQHINDGEARNYSSVASIADVIASSGETYFYDSTTNLVWVRVRGGLTRVGGYTYGPQSQESELCNLCIRSI
jgi:hypothetical protein